MNRVPQIKYEAHVPYRRHKIIAGVNAALVICRTFSRGPSQMFQKQQTRVDWGFSVQQLVDVVDCHLGDGPEVQELAFWIVVVQNGLETCQAQLHLHQRSLLALEEVTPNQYKAKAANEAKSLLCMLELHAMTLVCESVTPTAKIHLVLRLVNRLDPA